jgi:phosphoribosylformylglycinamidine synthase
VGCPDITLTVTPGLGWSGFCNLRLLTVSAVSDLKLYGTGVLLLVSLGQRMRLGTSALAHVYQQIGADCPDVEDATALESVFEVVCASIALILLLSLFDLSDARVDWQSNDFFRS